MITPTIKQIYELRDYKDDAIAFVAQETLSLHEDLIVGRLTQAEFIELIEDLNQTKTISDKANDLQTRLLLEQLINDLVSALGSG